MPLKCWAHLSSSSFWILYNRDLPMLDHQESPLVSSPVSKWGSSWPSIPPLPLQTTSYLPTCLPTQPSRTSAPTTFLQHVCLWLCDMPFPLLGTNRFVFWRFLFMCGGPWAQLLALPCGFHWTFCLSWEDSAKCTLSVDSRHQLASLIFWLLDKIYIELLFYI